MLYFVSFDNRTRRRLRIIYWVLARSVWRIERRRFKFGLWWCVCVVDGSADEAARSSIDSICVRTRSIIRSISAVGQGKTSETARSATQKRVRSWWSMAVDSGLAPGPWSTEARMSSISMVNDWVG